MYRKILFIGLLLITIAAKAHNADASTTMLVERENNTWVLQISASLTAFQHEIRTHFAETPYKTPEEFQQMVLEHIKNNLEIIFNDGDRITLGQGIVQLGHETKVVFEVLGIPSNVRSVRVKNSAFDDIHKSQSALLLFKQGFTKEKFVLNDANGHTLQLYVEGNTFKILDKKESNTSLSFISWVLGAIFLVAISLMAISNMFRPERITLRPVR